MAVAILVGVAHVNDDELFAGGETVGDVRRAFLGDDLPRLGEHVLERFHWFDITAIPGRFKGDARSATSSTNGPADILKKLR